MGLISRVSSRTYRKKTMDITLDPGIRVWIFAPIAFITFLFGLAMHYVRLIVQSEPNATLEQIKDSQIMMRSNYTRMNSRFVCPRAWHMRKPYFVDEDKGVLSLGKKKPAQQKNMMTDPTMAHEMMKGQLLNMVPNIVIGYLINMLFSGFLIAKVPFPLTFRFKSMLQRGVELPELDPSWISSASWYFICIFGLRRLYSLVLGENNQADPSKLMEQQMQGMAAGMANQDIGAAYKKEWEEFIVQRHQYVIKNTDTLLAFPGWKPMVK